MFEGKTTPPDCVCYGNHIPRSVKYRVRSKDTVLCIYSLISYGVHYTLTLELRCFLPHMNCRFTHRLYVEYVCMLPFFGPIVSFGCDFFVYIFLRVTSFSNPPRPTVIFLIGTASHLNIYKVVKILR